MSVVDTLRIKQVLRWCYYCDGNTGVIPMVTRFLDSRYDKVVMVEVGGEWIADNHEPN